MRPQSNECWDVALVKRHWTLLQCLDRAIPEAFVLAGSSIHHSRLQDVERLG